MANMVHVFVGNWAVEVEFRQYIERTITEGGDLHRSQFMKDCGIEKSELDSEEAFWFSRSLLARRLVLRCSYGGQFRADLPEDEGNCAVLLYEASEPTTPGGAVDLTYLGAYPWRPNE